jgi:hypothetical protein
MMSVTVPMDCGTIDNKGDFEMRKLIALVVGLATVAFVMGCSGGSSTSATSKISIAPTNTTAATTTAPTATPPKTTVAPTLSTDAILVFANPAAESMMKSFQNKSLDEYVQKGDAQFKAAVTQATFDQLAGPMQAQYGNFVSVQFKSAEMVQSYLVVHFAAKFEKGQLGLRVVFDSANLVAGQFFE